MVKFYLKLLRKLDYGSALAVRLTKITGKSKVPVHPKHLINKKRWFLNYITSNDVVLDVGSGNGQNALKIAKISRKVVGLELNSNLIKIANQAADNLKIKNVSFLKVNLEKRLTTKNNEFDKVLFLDVLEHLKNRDLILREIKRALKPNGLLMLGVPNSQTSWKKRLRKNNLFSYSDPDHKTEFSETQIVKLLAKHHFKIIQFNYGKYDTPFRGLYDVLGSISLKFYKYIDKKRAKAVTLKPQEASGFEIVVANLK